MKTLKHILFFSLLTIFSFSAAAQGSGIHPDIISSISQGNTAKLAPHLGNNVELVIDNKNDIYSKQQAIEIITDFFRKNTVIDFKILHSGAKDLSSFAIGSLKTSTGVYRVYILTRKMDGKSLIQQLRIESNNE
ncbi:MAG: DUF4783 domain-containing protein [Porphyromonadaceae bacterium]|nr:DUF4783 domain-containing protein [Porphyromonadaceae bacterium]